MDKPSLLCYMLLQHPVRVRACVLFLFFFLFFARTSLCWYLWLSATTLLYTYTQQQTLPQGHFALCRAYLWPMATHMNASPPSASVTYLSVTFFQQPICFDTCPYCMTYLHREETPQYTYILGIGNGELATKLPRPHRCNRVSFVAKNGEFVRRQHMRAYVDDCVACAVPTGHYINTSPIFTALLSCPGWTKVVFRIYFQPTI